MRRMLLALFALLTVAGSAFAQAPRTLSYQGVLTDADGVVAPDANHDMIFRLYDGDGSLLWEEALSVPTLSGRFNVVLGEVESLDGLGFDEPYFLGIAVNGAPEMTPREPLTSAPYSLNARTVEGGVVNTLNGLGGNVSLVAGENVALTPVGNSIEISAIGGPPVHVVMVSEESGADAGDTDDAVLSIAVVGPNGPITGLDEFDFYLRTLWVPAGGAAVAFSDFTDRGNGQYTYRMNPAALTWKVGGYSLACYVSTPDGNGSTVHVLTVDK